MDSVVKLLWTFVGDDGATTAIEYPLIASIISISIATVVVLIGASLETIFDQVADSL